MYAVRVFHRINVSSSYQIVRWQTVWPNHESIIGSLSLPAATINASSRAINFRARRQVRGVVCTRMTMTRPKLPAPIVKVYLRNDVSHRTLILRFVSAEAHRSTRSAKYDAAANQKIARACESQTARYPCNIIARLRLCPSLDSVYRNIDFAGESQYKYLARIQCICICSNYKCVRLCVYE